MAIQFTCGQCGQPIEVDAEHAGKSAACPYCRSVSQVPAESTYDPAAAVMARTVPVPPAATGAPSVPGASQAYAGWGLEEAAAKRARTARVLGDCALGCLMLAVLLFGFGSISLGKIMSASGLMQRGTPPTPDEIAKLQNLVLGDPALIGALFGGMLLGVGGLILSVVSLIVDRRGNWRAIVGLAICGAFVLCVCSSALMSGMGLAPR